MKKLSFLITFIISLAFSNIALSDVFKKEFEDGSIGKLKLSNTSGSIDIIGSKDGKSSINVNKVKMGKDCKMTVDHSGETLLVEIKSTSWLGAKECRADLNINLPAQASLDIRSASGDIDIRDSVGDIKFWIGSGDLSIKANSEKVYGKVGSGGIKIDGTIGDSELSTGSGDISLKLEKILKDSSLRIHSGSGDTTILLPDNSQIATQFSAGSGEIYNELGQSQNPDLNIRFRAGSGDLNIKRIK